MTDDLSPPEPIAEAEAEVTRLLSEAAGPVTMPAEVSARLDDVLAGLVADRTEPLPGSLGEVIPRRQGLGHRRWPQVLVAAAAVSVIGYGGSVLMTRSSSDDQATTADAGAAADHAMQPEGAAPEAPAPADADSTAESRAPTGQAMNDHFLVDGLSSLRTTDQSFASGAKTLKSCQAPERVDPAATREAVVDGMPVVVVVRKVSATTSRADVYPCRGGIFPIATTLLLDAK